MRHRHRHITGCGKVLIGALLLPQVFFQATLEGRIAQVAQRRRQLVIFRYSCEQVAPPSGLWSNDRRQKHITLPGVSPMHTLPSNQISGEVLWFRRYQHLSQQHQVVVPMHAVNTEPAQIIDDIADMIVFSTAGDYSGSESYQLLKPTSLSYVTFGWAKLAFSFPLNRPRNYN